MRGKKARMVKEINLDDLKHEISIYIGIYIRQLKKELMLTARLEPTPILVKQIL